MKWNKHDYEIISQSGMFCHDWFKINYNLNNIDLIEYYLEFGVEKGLNPSPFFDTLWYLEKYSDVKNSDMNPFVHYIKYGANENRIPNPSNKLFSKFSLYNLDYNPCFLKCYDDLIRDFNNNFLSNRINIAFFFKSDDGNFLPTSYIRLIIPYYHLFLENNINPYVFYGNDFKKMMENPLFKDEKLFDIIIVQRDCLDYKTAEFLAELCSLHDTKLIYEIDDDLLGIEENHPDFQEFILKSTTIEFLLINADYVTVSTNVLKERLNDYNPNIKVIKNFTNDLLERPRIINKFSNDIKIGYMGSFTHKNDLKILEEVIIEVKQYFAEKDKNVIFEIIGGTNENINFANLIEIPHNSRKYPNFIKWLRNTVNWDIALAPLENTNINASKSEIKYIEYSSMGIPGIFSDVGAYSEVIKNGENGILVKNNSIEEWKKAIIELIENKLLQKSIIENSKEDIKKNYSVERMVKSWNDLFNELLDENQLKLFNENNDYILLTNPIFNEEYHTILKSGLFNENWYLECYDDVKYIHLDPIYHYISMGMFEGCNPFKNFDTLDYCKVNEIDINRINPFVHYIKNHISNFKFNQLNNNAINSIFENLEKKVSIIIPIYNAYEDTKCCIESVLKYSTKNYELILINDCSTDKRINELLDSYKDFTNIKIINNQVNKGFVGTVNEGFKTSKNDVIMLNSDTIVTPKWLEKLTIAAYSDEKIGTVTPFSNNSGAFSVPDIGVENKIPKNLNLNSLSNIVEKVSNHEYMHVPTGNGFCMYVKRELINSIGLLDEETFGRGYGEENDFCMRAIEAGWINIIDDSTYILHNKGSSFSSDREELIKEHRKLLDEKHPTYTDEVRKFVNSPLLKTMQDNIRFGLSNFSIKNFNKKRILFVIHSNSGGTPKTNEDLMKQVEKYADCYLLFAHTHTMILYHFENSCLIKIKEWSFDSRWWAEMFYNEKYEEIYFNILHNLQIDLVHIRHLLHHTFDLPIVSKKLGIPVVLSFHDFYMVCPSFTLLDENYDYCQGVCNDNLVNCKVPSKGITQEPIMKSFVEKWRFEVKKLFEYVDCFITTSEVVKEVFTNIFRNSFDDNFFVIEHGRNFPIIKEKLFEVPSEKKPIKILFTGNILRHKGSMIIKELYDLDIEKNIEFHFLGTTDESLKNIGIHHGTYKREELYKKISLIKPSFIGIFSIWPETFCHTLTEAWSCGIPVLATNIGVIQDRVEKNNGGIFIDKDDSVASYNIILDIKNNPKKYIEIQKNVEKIYFKSEEEMGEDYIKIYDSLLEN